MACYRPVCLCFAVILWSLCLLVSSLDDIKNGGGLRQNGFFFESKQDVNFESNINNEKRLLPVMESNNRPSFRRNNTGHDVDRGREHMQPHFAQNPSPTRSAQRLQVPVKISQHPDCKNDVTTYCASSSASNNFAILECLQSDKGYKISENCQDYLWSYKRNLTTDLRFDSAAGEVCRDSLGQFPECGTMAKGKGLVISCLINHKENLTSTTCQQFLTKMASIVFSDYRLIFKFTQSCDSDIKKMRCGRLNGKGDNLTHTQGQTVECLSNHVKELQPACKHEILRIAELQSDDYHMDRPLFYSCQEDREKFCKNTKAGGGKVFRCLYRHKFDEEMTTECQNQLVRRQKMMREDYKINRALSDACHTDIRKHKCLKGNDGQLTKTGKLAHILLCLQGVLRDGDVITPECITEMNAMRQSMMEDYQITPDLVAACDAEINDHCKHGLQREGKTLHCLMDLARPQKDSKKYNSLVIIISSKCKTELMKLLREADVGSNYKLDPALHEVCQEVVEIACTDIKAGEGEGDVLTCLMGKMGSVYMTTECEEKLMEIQYFIARDFKLDAHLYKHCRKDANRLCSAPEKWYDPDSTAPEQGPLVFPCLYRHVKLHVADPDRQLNRACAHEVRRVMRQRAISVELEPRIQTPCLADLGALCSDDTDKGKEMQCLQENIDQLSMNCKIAVSNYTEDVDEDPELDRISMVACTPMIKIFCENLLNKEEAEPGDVMECLIEHKHDPDMNTKCAAGIEHHQLTTLTDFHLSYKFKDACKKDVADICRSGVKRKFEVIQCLSEAVRNDTLLEASHRVSRGCRRQLKFEILQRGENIELDSVLKEACENDRLRFCGNVSPGMAQVIECLKQHRKKLDHRCHVKIFTREKEQAQDTGTDYLLMSTCKRMVKRYCAEEDQRQVLRCLKTNIYTDNGAENPNFDTKCRILILERLRTKKLDYRLNPQLQAMCKMDIDKFCKSETAEAENMQYKELGGQMITCLRIRFAQKKLTSDCTSHMREVIRESALDYQQDPILASACAFEIKKWCLEAVIAATAATDDKGRVTECLKDNMADNKIRKEACVKEIARVLAEDIADVHVDPILHRACALDLHHYCQDVPSGEGRQMSCLLAALDEKSIRLRKECSKALRDRRAMWEYAAKVAPPETLQDLFVTVATSQSRNYFVGIIFAVIGIIFIGGLFCVRVTKRVAGEQKQLLGRL